MCERQSRRLSEIIAIKHGFAFPGANFSEDPTMPTLLTPGNFAIGGGFKETKPKTLAGDYPQEYELSPGDLVITMTDLSKQGDTLGLPALVPDRGRYLHNQRIGLVEVRDESVIDKSFLSYYLRTDAYRAYILGTASGSTVKHTSPSKIGSFLADLPSLSEQRAIARILGALDDKIAANTRLAETSAQLAGLIYDQFVAEVPTRPMSETLTPILGGTPARSRTEYWDGDCLWASAKDVTGAPFGVVADTVEKISASATAGTKAKPLPKGSVILTARGTVGAVARLSRASSFNQSCYGFAPDSLPAGILFHAIMRATQRAKAIAHGSVFDTITKKTLEHLTLPDLDNKAISKLEARLEPLLQTVDWIVEQNQTLTATRDKLLPHLMFDRLSIEDAEQLVVAV